MRQLIVLDLDETLLHASKHDGKWDFQLWDYNVQLRPYLEHFLDFVFDNFDVAVWTSGGDFYCEEIVKRVFDGRDLKFAWSNKRCTLHQYVHLGGYEDKICYEWLKPIKKITRRKIYKKERIIAIDDTPLKWSRSYGNFIRIKPFYGDTSDIELLKLEVYLKRLIDCENVRILEKRDWAFQVEEEILKCS